MSATDYVPPPSAAQSLADIRHTATVLRDQADSLDALAEQVAADFAADLTSGAALHRTRDVLGFAIEYATRTPALSQLRILANHMVRITEALERGA